MTYPKVYRPDGEAGGDSLVVASGGSITVETGGSLTGTRIERKSVTVLTTSATAGATTQILDRIYSSSLPFEVKSVTMTPAGSVAGHATSNFVLAVRCVGTGATEALDAASLTLTTGNAMTANVPKAFTLSATGGVDVAANAALVFHVTLASLGLDMPRGILTVEYAVDAS